MLLLDTSAVSAVMKRAEAALLKLQKFRPGDVVICAPVAAEIHYGLERLERGSHRRSQLEAEYIRLRKAVAWKDWSEDAAMEYGRVKAELERRGTPVDDMDLIISSIALSLCADVATCNPKHFQCVEGLTAQDWRE